MKKKLVFISHITEEKAIATALKALVEDTFQGLITVFVSSDPTSNPMGGRWLDLITDALRECVVEIILASPESIRRPWINFEAGSGWIRGIPVIPLCHSGLDRGNLPAPMCYLQAANAADESQLKLIFPAIAEAVGSALPPADFGPFIQNVRQFEADTKRIREMNAGTPIAPTHGLSPHEFATLVGIGEEIDTQAGTTGVHTARSRVEGTGVTKIAFSLAMIKLERMSLIRTTTDHDWNGNEFEAVQLTPEGWQWLEDNKDQLLLSKQQKGKRFQPPPNAPADEGGDIPF